MRVSYKARGAVSAGWSSCIRSLYNKLLHKVWPEAIEVARGHMFGHWPIVARGRVVPVGARRPSHSGCPEAARRPSHSGCPEAPGGLPIRGARRLP